MNEPDLTIVIPTFNRSDLVRNCLQSLMAQTSTAVDILVVDDGGSDDTQSVIQEMFPSVRYVRREMNGGFAAAVNTGIRNVRTPFVMLLNNDITLAPDCIEALIKYADSGSIVGPLQLMDENHEVVYAAGDRLRVNGRPESIGFRTPHTSMAHTEPVFGITAGAALYPRELFERVGAFDERFVAYFEDSDLNFRARLAGYRARLIPEAVAYHRGAASIQDRLWWRTRQCFRNHMLLVLKNYPSRLLIRYAAPIAVEHFRGYFRVFNAVRCHHGFVRAVNETVRAKWSLFVAIPHTLRERGRVQRMRTASDEDVASWLARV